MADLNKFSARVTQPKYQGSSQAMLFGTGLTPEEMNKPQVGIASMWWEGNPCNMHLNDLAAAAREGVQAADLVGMRFNTIGVSDGISMGTTGMRYSLPSRDVIADSIETVCGAQWYDVYMSGETKRRCVRRAADTGYKAGSSVRELVVRNRKPAALQKAS